MMGGMNPKRGRLRRIAGWVVIAIGVVRVAAPAVYAAGALNRPMALPVDVLAPSLVMVAAGVILIIWGRKARGQKQ